VTKPHLAEPVVLQHLLDVVHLGQQPDGTAIKQLGLRQQQQQQQQ
jgi:hypothetical protein